MRESRKSHARKSRTLPGVLPTEHTQNRSNEQISAHLKPPLQKPQSVTSHTLLKDVWDEMVFCWLFWRDTMTTLQFIAGMILCLAALGVRAYLLFQYHGKERAGRSKNQ